MTLGAGLGTWGRHKLSGKRASHVSGIGALHDKYGLIGSFSMESCSEAKGSSSDEISPIGSDLSSKVLVGRGMVGIAPLDGLWKRSPLRPIVEEAQIPKKGGLELAKGLDDNVLVGGGP